MASLLTRGSLPDVRNYLRNRGLRILPAYWVVLTIVAVVLPAALLRRSPSELSLDRLVSRPDTLVSNALFVQNYVPGSLDTGIGPAWSLAVEVVFYLSLPVLAVLARAGFRRARSARGRVLALLAPPAALLLLGTAGKAATVLLEDHDPGSDILARSFLSLADLFAPGMALAVLFVLVQERHVRLPRRLALVLWVLLVVDVLAVVALTDRGRLPDWGVANPYQRLTALACVLLVALVVLPRPAPVSPGTGARDAGARGVWPGVVQRVPLARADHPAARRAGRDDGRSRRPRRQPRHDRGGDRGSRRADLPLRGAPALARKATSPA